MHVCEQETVSVSVTMTTQATKVCRHKCKNPACNKVFFNAHGTKCHQGKYRRKNTYVMYKIMESEGGGGGDHGRLDRRYRVR